MTAPTYKPLRIVLIVFSAPDNGFDHGAVASNEANKTFDSEDLINGSIDERKRGHRRPPLAPAYRIYRCCRF